MRRVIGQKMKIRFVWVLVLSQVGCMGSLLAHSPTRILVTGYEGFEGRADNSTEAAIRALETQLSGSELSLRTELQALILPVEFSTAHLRLIAAVESFRPAIVLSFGEGAINAIKI